MAHVIVCTTVDKVPVGPLGVVMAAKHQLDEPNFIPSQSVSLHCAALTPSASLERQPLHHSSVAPIESDNLRVCGPTSSNVNNSPGIVLVANH